jgi:hypothetical protein
LARGNGRIIGRRSCAEGGHLIAAGGGDRLRRQRFSDAVHGCSEAGDGKARDDTD